MIEDIRIPEISENVESGTVVAILVAVGDFIEAEDPVIEFETDKAVVEIPSPHRGKVTEVLVAEGEEKEVGEVIARVDTEAEEKEEDDRPDEAAATEEEGEAEEEESPGGGEQEENQSDGASVEKKEKETEESKEEKGKEMEGRGTSGREPDGEGTEGEKGEQAEAASPEAPIPAGPSVRRLARELGVDLQRVEGSGPGGRITDADVKRHVKEDRSGGGKPRPSTSAPEAEGAPLPDFSRWGEVEAEDLGSVRRIIAERTAAAWRTVPHVTQFDEADVTELASFLDRNAEPVRKAGGKLTLTAVLMKVCAEALLRHPRFNASLDLPNRRIVFKRYVHIGLMVDTPRGLLVPVVRDADRKSITELAVEVVELAGKARDRKIAPEEMEGGTFSISNQGGIGGTGFTPVVLWPQAAVLGVSRTQTRPMPSGDTFRPRTVLPLALSYDHRIVDGADAARFLRWICRCLEQPMTMHLTRPA